MDFSRTFAYSSIKNLRPHPLNEKIYGEQRSDKKLAESIKAHGVLSPIIVNKKKQILSGHRRWLAAKEAGLMSVPVTGFRGTSIEEELLLIESNRQRAKTEDQKNSETAELLRIEKALAKERQKEGGKVKVRQNLAEPSKAVERIAEKTGESPETTRKRIALAEAHVTQGDRSVDRAYREDIQRLAQKKQKKSETQLRVAELQKLFSRRVEVQGSKELGKFNIFFYKQTEAQIREIAKALA